MSGNIIFWSLKSTPHSGKFQYEEGVGLHKLSMIAKQQGWSTMIYNDHQFGADPQKIKNVTRDNLCAGKNIIAYSIMSHGMELLKQVAQECTFANIPVICGGAGASIEPERVLNTLRDYRNEIAVVQGDGERVFSELLATEPKKWNTVKNAWSINDGNIVKGAYDLLEDLDLSPFADLDASSQRQESTKKTKDENLPLEKRIELLKSLTVSQIESRRGCYFNCEFCSTSSLPTKVRQVRKSTPKRLVSEMVNMFMKHGITFFSLTDNIAFDNVAWWKEFTELMKKSEIASYVQFGGYSSPKIMSRKEWLDFLPELYATGLRGIILGVQAGTNRVLKDIIHRPADDPENAFAIARHGTRIGLNIKTDFILGHPTETIEELETTRRWIDKIYSTGGEVFVRELNIVPQSGYARKIEHGIYSLPARTSEYNRKVSEIMDLRRMDDNYRKIAFAKGIPNKYLIDRNLRIAYPSTIFGLETLKENADRLALSDMPNHVKARYHEMFELVMRLKREKKEYNF